MKMSQCHCSKLREAARTLTLVYDHHLLPIGLTITQFSILSRLTNFGQMTVNEFADNLGMDRTTLVANIKRLTKLGLVKMDVGDDRRTRVIRLSSKGSDVFTQAQPLWAQAQNWFEQLYGKRKSQQLVSFFDEMHGIRDAIKKEFGLTVA
jgi:DNA-binding MarR family transcriptional regulator